MLNQQLLVNNDNKKRDRIILVLFLIFSFITSPLYFLPPDGLFNKLFLIIDPSFENSGLAGGFIGTMAGFIAIPVFAFIYFYLTTSALVKLKSTISSEKILAFIELIVVIIAVIYPIITIIQAWT